MVRSPVEFFRDWNFEVAISGHRTTSVFRRYNVVTEEELQKVKWKPDEKIGVHIGVYQP